MRLLGNIDQPFRRCAAHQVTISSELSHGKDGALGYVVSASGYRETFESKRLLCPAAIDSTFLVSVSLCLGANGV